MHAFQALLVVAAAATAVSASAIDNDSLFTALLKRQEPGTGAHACHDNCGQVIKQGRELDDPCSSDAFLSNYANCLQCAGPDNYGIWMHYGNSVSNAGKACGLETEPKSGKQPDVGPATPAEDGGSSSPSPSTSSPASEPTDDDEPAPEPTDDDEPAPEPTDDDDDEPAPEPTAPSGTESSATSAEPPAGTDAASETDSGSASPTGTASPTDDDAEESGAAAVDAAGSVRIGAFMGIFMSAVLGASLIA